jgi:hypothetical protein
MRCTQILASWTVIAASCIVAHAISLHICDFADAFTVLRHLPSAVLCSCVLLRTTNGVAVPGDSIFSVTWNARAVVGS